MKYVVVVAILMSALYMGMTQVALEAVQSIAPYYQHAEEIAQSVAAR